MRNLRAEASLASDVQTGDVGRLDLQSLQSGDGQVGTPLVSGPSVEQHRGDAIALKFESVEGPVRAWGIVATLAWVLLAPAAGILVAGVASRGLSWWSDGAFGNLLVDGFGSPASASLIILLEGVVVGVIVVAARLSGASTSTYLSFVRPRGHFVLAGLMCLVLPALITFAHAMHFDVTEFFRPMGFQRARAAGALPLHFTAVAIVAPVMEEVVFRGFLYRGLAASRLGVAGAIVLTSIPWTLLHIGHDTAGIIDLMLCGIAWGWLRWYTGSTWTSLAAHLANNCIAVLLVLSNPYGWVSIS